MSEEKASASTQFLTFRLDEESFALDVSKVREILDFSTVTKVPQTPEYMRGVINLRGHVVPVMDLRVRFGMSETAKTVDSCIIVTELSLEEDLLVLGVLADAVQEVIDLAPEQIEPPPKLGTKLSSEFIYGMGKHADQFIIILDMDRVFSDAADLAGEATEECAA